MGLDGGHADLGEAQVCRVTPSAHRFRVAFKWLVAAGGALLIWTMFRQFEHSQVYHPSRETYGDAASLRRPFEDVRFAAEDGVALHGWFFPADASSPRKNWVILQCHGNAGNISGRLMHFQALLTTGVSLFAFDYRGYGRSEGEPDEEGTYRDVRAAHDWLIAKGFQSGDIIVLGESLGGGIGSKLAMEKPVKALILERTFTSVPDVASELFPFLPVRLLGSIQYDTINRMERIDAPVLALHARDDEIVKFHHGEKLFAAASEPKMFRELEGGHNDTLLVNRDRYLDALEDFFGMLE